MRPSTYSNANGSRSRNDRNAGRIALALSLALGLAGLASFAWHAFAAPAEEARTPALAGRDWNGARYELAADQGRVRLVFFGYTHCPDICPGSFARARRLAGELTPAEAAELSVVFVSVDPERDTPEVLSNYVAAFDTRFHGLWLETDALARTLQDFGAVAERRGGAAQAEAYTLDHTSSFFLFDRAGTLRTSLPFDGEFRTLLEHVRELLGEPRPLGAPAPEAAPQSVPATAPPANAPAESCCAEAPASPTPAPEALAHFENLTLRSARLGPTPGAVAALYLTLENAGPGDERLVGVRSAAEASELHETVHDGETARMEARPEGFALPAGGALELAPGGKHVMLIGLPGALAVGDALELVLVFEQAGEWTVVLPVEERTW